MTALNNYLLSEVFLNLFLQRRKKLSKLHTTRFDSGLKCWSVFISFLRSSLILRIFPAVFIKRKKFTFGIGRRLQMKAHVLKIWLRVIFSKRFRFGAI